MKAGMHDNLWLDLRLSRTSRRCGASSFGSTPAELPPVSCHPPFSPNPPFWPTPPLCPSYSGARLGGNSLRPADGQSRIPLRGFCFPGEPEPWGHAYCQQV